MEAIFHVCVHCQIASRHIAPMEVIMLEAMWPETVTGDRWQVTGGRWLKTLCWCWVFQLCYRLKNTETSAGVGFFNTATECKINTTDKVLVLSISPLVQTTVYRTRVSIVYFNSGKECRLQKQCWYWVFQHSNTVNKQCPKWNQKQ